MTYVKMKDNYPYKTEGQLWIAVNNLIWTDVYDSNLEEPKVVSVNKVSLGLKIWKAGMDGTNATLKVLH